MCDAIEISNVHAANHSVIWIAHVCDPLACSYTTQVHIQKTHNCVDFSLPWRQTEMWLIQWRIRVGCSVSMKNAYMRCRLKYILNNNLEAEAFGSPDLLAYYSQQHYTQINATVFCVRSLSTWLCTTILCGSWMGMVFVCESLCGFANVLCVGYLCAILSIRDIFKHTHNRT